MRKTLTSRRVLIGLAIVLGVNSQLNDRHLGWVGAAPNTIVKTLAGPPASVLRSVSVGLRGEDAGPALVRPGAIEQDLIDAGVENRWLWEENSRLNRQLERYAAAAAVRGSQETKFVDARIAGLNLSRSNPTVELDKGSRAGVQAADPVVYSANLVGFVQDDVGAFRSTARLVTAPESQYGVRLIRPGSTTADASLRTYIYTDDSGGFFYCDLPDGGHDVSVGDLAAMADDRYAEANGYILGVVSEVRPDHPEQPLDLDRIIIQPGVDPARLRGVTISIQVRE